MSLNSPSSDALRASYHRNKRMSCNFLGDLKKQTRELRKFVFSFVNLCDFVHMAISHWNSDGFLHRSTRRVLKKSRNCEVRFRHLEFLHEILLKKECDKQRHAHFWGDIYVVFLRAARWLQCFPALCVSHRSTRRAFTEKDDFFKGPDRFQHSDFGKIVFGYFDVIFMGNSRKARE